MGRDHFEVSCFQNSFTYQKTALTLNIISKGFFMVICFLIKLYICSGSIYPLILFLQTCASSFPSSMETWPNFRFYGHSNFHFSSLCYPCHLVDISKFSHLQLFFPLFKLFLSLHIFQDSCLFFSPFEMLFNTLIILGLETPLKVIYFVRNVLGCK